MSTTTSTSSPPPPTTSPPWLPQVDVSCPFCGLLCDDLSASISADHIDTHGCERAALAYRQATDAARTELRPQINGQDCDFDTAITHAAKLLAASEAPLLSGLQVDVNGARAALALAETLGAGLDHDNGDALLANVRVLQRDGWVTTTLAEVRNRADHIVIVGSPALFKRFPRLIERVLQPVHPENPASEPTLLPERLAQRRFTFIGPWQHEPLPASLSSDASAKDAITRLPLELTHAAELIGAVRAYRNSGHAPIADSKTLPALATALAGVASLCDALDKAAYTVFVWAAADLPHNRDLCVDAICALLRDLNDDGRAAGLPLAGSGGDVTVNQVCTWQTGYPLPIGFSGDSSARWPHFDPALYRARDRLADGGCDLLLWLATLTPEAPPEDEDEDDHDHEPHNTPQILIGHPQLYRYRDRADQPPAVFIPTGIPGIDHAGHLYRSDAVVALPLKKLRATNRPPAAEVLRLIQQRLITDQTEATSC